MERFTCYSEKALHGYFARSRDRNFDEMAIVFWLVTPKSVPPKIGLAGPILAKKTAKSGPPDHFFCQNQSGRTNFGNQNWSPLANFGPPTLLFPILHYSGIAL